MHPVRGDLDRLADAGQRDRPLAQHGTRPHGQVLQLDAVGLVGLLEAVHQGPALDRGAAAHRVDAAVRVGPARGQVQVQGDLVARLPAAAKLVIAGRGLLVLVVHRDAGARAPGRDPHRDPALGGGGGQHAQVDRAGPRVVRGHLQLKVRTGQAGPGVLVHVQGVAGGRGQVVLERGQQAHDVRRAAGAAEPGPPPSRVVLLEVVRAALQRVHVEEALPVGGHRGAEPVVEHAFHVIRVLGVAGGQQQPPGPVETGDRGAGLVVRAVRRQLEPVAEALVDVPRAVAAGEVRLGGHHVVPAAQRGLQQRAVAQFGGHVGHPGLEVQGSHHVSHRGVQGPHRHMVLQVAAAQAGVPGQPVAALLDELAGELEVVAAAGLPVQLDQRGLDDRVAVEALLLARERAHQVVGQPDRDGQQAAVAGAAVVRDRGLDQVPRAVHLVAGGQPGVPRLAGDLEVGVQVAVRPLGPLEETGHVGGEGSQLRAVSVGEFPADRLEGLVDVGVHEHRAAVARSGRGGHRIPGGGPFAVPVGVGALGSPHGQAHVVQVAGLFELAQGERQARGQAPPLPPGQQAAGQAGPGDRPVRPGRGGAGRDGPRDAIRAAGVGPARLVRLDWRVERRRSRG